MDKIQKLTKKDSTLFIIGIILIGICAFFIFLGIDDLNQNKYTNLPRFYDVKEEDQKAYIIATVYPYAVASSSDDKMTFAIVADEDNILYLIKGKVSLIQDEYDKQEESGKVILKGTSKKTPENIIEFTIEGYNEYADEEIVDKYNFSSYFGEYYLDLDDFNDTAYGFFVIGTIFAIFGIVMTVSGIKNKNNTKKTMESEIFPVAQAEAETPELESKQAIFTKNYIICYENGLNIINYNDIVWIYRHTVVYNGIPSQFLAYYVRNRKKVKMIPAGMKESNVNELIEHIYSKNPNVLVGFTKENQDLYKNIN